MTDDMELVREFATRQLDASMKQAHSAMKSGKIVFTHIHVNIAVNKKFSATDAAP